MADNSGRTETGRQLNISRPNGGWSWDCKAFCIITKQQKGMGIGIVFGSIGRFVLLLVCNLFSYIFLFVVGAGCLNVIHEVVPLEDTHGGDAKPGKAL